MGIPRFYRWLSERYPLINEQITAEQIPEFDNLYLDMNGIIHNCSHNNTGGLCVNDENDVFVESFKYIARLVHIIKPKQLLYMAIDGCAPRAKMNQQRSRRFRAANEAREAREKAEAMGDTIVGTPFDSNCITPGTEFMARLTAHLQFFVQKKIQEDPSWQGITVIVSGPDVPGEGEHKIVDYIRRSKAQPDYNPNLRHCMYGLDADLIMLALASHEPHFALLREEVVFGRQQTENVEQRMFIQKDRFQLLHIALLREYLDLEFSGLKDDNACPNRLERIVDDFVLFCVLVGNDFLPHLPFSEIGDGGLEKFMSTYKHHLKHTTSEAPWLTKDCGAIAWDQFSSFLREYAEIENDKLHSCVDDGGFVLGRRRRVGPMCDDIENRDLVLDSPPNAELARVQYYEIKFGFDIETYEGVKQQRGLFISYLEGLQWVMFYYYRGPDGASWSWYYPYYHAPMIFDLCSYDELSEPNLQFDIGQPFLPFQQLMAVLPERSKTFLPECYRWLFDSPSSPILDFYPTHFDIDVDGVTVPWGGVTLIPFIDPASLLKAMIEAEKASPNLTDAELSRNSFHSAMAFHFDRGTSNHVHSSMPDRFSDILRCPVHAKEISHPALDSATGYLNGILPGCDLQSNGFPSLRRYELTSSFETGVKVFQTEARGQSLIVNVQRSCRMTPDKEAIAELMKSARVQIDYPCIHFGKVVAVHTASLKYLPSGKTSPNNPRDHENLVRQITMDLRRKGLTIGFGNGVPAAGDVAAGRSQDIFLQPLAEVKAIETSYLDADGKTQCHYRNTTEFRLLHLVQAEEAPKAVGSRSIAERFPLDTSVVCLAKDSDCFAQTGAVECNSSSEALEAIFEKDLTKEEQNEFQYEIQRIVQEQHQTLHWYDISQVASQTGLTPHVINLVFRSVNTRSTANVREDMGMNLIYESRNDGSCFCLPTFSRKSQAGWRFSNLAVEALKDYAAKYPEFFAALHKRQRGDRDLEAAVMFWEHPDAGYAFQKMVKYVNASAFKKLRFVPEKHMALTSTAISQIASVADEVYKRVAARSVQVERIKGYRRLYKAEDLGSRPPHDFFPQSGDLTIGQRVVYIKPHGLIPCGAKGTLVAVYGEAVYGASVYGAAECEVLLDRDNFGSTTLHGRAPSMRGFRASTASFMPLPPWLTPSSVVPPASALAAELFGRISSQTGSSIPASGEDSHSHVQRDRANSEASNAILNMLKSPSHQPLEEPQSVDSGVAASLSGTGNQLVSTASDRIMAKLTVAAQEEKSKGKPENGIAQTPTPLTLPLPKFGAGQPPGLDLPPVSSNSTANDITQSTEGDAVSSGKGGRWGGKGNSKAGKASSGRGNNRRQRAVDQQPVIDWAKAFEELFRW